MRPLALFKPTMAFVGRQKIGLKITHLGCELKLDHGGSGEYLKMRRLPISIS